MKLLGWNGNKVKINIENLDDLWYLNSIIDPSDVVEGKTFRKLKLGDSSDRNQKVIKKPIFLKISVEKIEFHKYSDVLRVSGKVSEGTDDVPSGSYHTFNIEDNTSFFLTKKEWLKFQKKILTEASKEKSPDVMIVILDRDEGHFFLLKKYGYSLLTSIQGNVAKKGDTRHQTTDFYSEVLTILEEYVSRHNIKKIIVGSPAFWKEDFLKKVVDEDLRKKIVLATCGSGDKSSINEILKRAEVRQVLNEITTADDLKLVEKLLEEISKDGAFCYGLKESISSSDSGAMKDVLVTEGLIRTSRENGKYPLIEKIMKNSDRSQGTIHIIASDSDAGKKLDGLGGIAGILRYKLNY